jgi:hypothetical protein
MGNVSSIFKKNKRAEGKKNVETMEQTEVLLC